jgi:hypothetical protein
MIFPKKRAPSGGTRTGNLLFRSVRPFTPCGFSPERFFPHGIFFLQNGWFKLLTAEEGEFYNVPVPSEDEDLTANLKKMRVSKTRKLFLLKNTILIFL